MKPGDRIGHIQVAELLGRGGMGDVYAGFDEKLQREVAIKILREGRWKRVARARLLREARALSRLDHPHICAIYDLIETPEGDALVLERIVGRNLRQAVRAGLDRASRLRIAEELAEALVVAHAHGIVHRDLKPTNVLLTPEGSVKVLDFGLAYSPEDAEATVLRASRREGEAPSLLQSALPEEGAQADELETAPFGASPEDTADIDSTEAYRTQFGEVVGTLPAMSPEQARGEPVTFASDMYAFGLLLQKLFTGRPAYDSTLPIPRLLFEVQEGRRRPLSGVGGRHAELIRTLCSVAPEKRPTAAAALARLRRIREAPKRWALRGALAATVLLALAGVAKYTFDLKRERDAALTSEVAAERAGGEAEAVVDFLVGMFRVADPGESLGNRITARELLDRGAERLKTELANQPTRRARLADAIGQTYQRLGLYPQAEVLLSEALELNRRQLGNESTEV
ncbi:MAG TPA: serine/threonine-protein kinase, partial [Thermoanaerobaculia bacterium]|nr:serine/threonine-protein kinase [Thermoanaerobaculia bacterium]